jgi:hypothetical protein
MEYIIYKIKSKDINITDIYIGSVEASQYNQRKANHKLYCETYNRNYKVYNFIRTNGGFNSFEFEIVERKFFENSIEARMLEENYRQELHTENMNTRKAYRTIEEKKIYENNYNKRKYQLEKVSKSMYNLLNNHF